MLIAGINAFHGDASAAALVDGRLAAAIEEERFTRVKHTAGFPGRALRRVVEMAGAEPPAVTHVAVARNPWARVLQKVLYGIKLPRLALKRLRVQGRFAGIGDEVARALGVQAERLKIFRVEHHTAHLASAFFVSPFEEAALLSVDGLGDFASMLWGVGRGSRIEPRGSVLFPHSLGFLYTAITQYLGFPKYGDEYKVMGLASYGQPAFLDELRRMVTDAPGADGLGFALDLDYFVHHRQGAEMTWDEGEPILGPLYSEHLIRRLGPARAPGSPIEPRHEQIAASLQARTEEVLLERLRRLRRETGMKALCLAGGVAFNCVVNGKIRRETGFEEVYVQPAAGDAGLAIGAAAYAWHQVLGHPRSFVMEHAYWGPEFSEAEVRGALEARGLPTEGEASLPDGATVAARRVPDEQSLCEETARSVARGEVVGWFQGRMEWGPRALGNRSIVADARRPEMREILNVKIKRRETFRPFAPSIIEEAVPDYFEDSYPSPFMLMAYRVRPDKREAIPAVTHVDGTGRLQSVNERQNRLYYKLIREFGRQTGVPVVLNTSFNENEPVVCTPAEGIDCFLRTKMDVLAIGPFFLRRLASGGAK